MSSDRDRGRRRAISSLPEGEPIQEVDEEKWASKEERENLIQHAHDAARKIIGPETGAASSGTDSRTQLGIRMRRPILGVEGESFFPASPFTQETGMVNIRRPVYSQSNFTKTFEEAPPNDLNKRFLDTIFLPKRNRPKLGETLFNLFPFAKVMKNYSWRQHLAIDIITGLTTGVMRIPQSMAYAFLAHLRPEAGLYTAFISAVFYVVFGGSSHMVVGAQGVVSLMVGSRVNQYVESTVGNVTAGNATQNALIQAASKEVVGTLAFMAGIIQVSLGILQLGFITNYLSDPLIGGFTTGAACQVVVSQMKDILGISGVNASGIFNVLNTIYQLFEKLGDTNVATLLISLYCLIVLVAIKLLNARLKPKFPFPGELLVMISVILFSYYTKVDETWNVNVVGFVPAGFESPQVPNMSLIGRVIDVSFTSAIVSFAIGYSIAKRLALNHDYEVSGNQEVFAFGVMNLGNSFFHGLVATSTMSASALHDSLGGTSQLANIVAAFIVLMVILFLGFLFEPAPDCVLSAIILVNLKSILMQFRDLKVLWRVSKIDFLLWIVTFLAVVILDVDIGLLVGVTFSLLTVVFRTQWPYVCELGRIPSTDLYKNRSITPEAVTIDGIRIFRFEGSLYFASAEHFRKSLYKHTDCNPYKIVAGRERFESKIKKLRSVLQGAKDVVKRKDSVTDETTPLLMSTAPTLPGKKEVHHIIIDFSTCSFMDSVGVRTLNQCMSEYKEAGISVYLANVRAAVRNILFNESSHAGVSPRKIFVSVHDAVLAALEAAQKVEERDYVVMDAMTRSFLTHNVSRIPSDSESVAM